MKAALDYSKLANIYDDYCVFMEDIGFFRHRAQAVSGKILELMAGTGRISIPLISGGARLTCVDNSAAMLAVLQRKLRSAGLHAHLLCADVRELPLRGKYSLVLLPFQGFTELATPEDQLSALRATAAVLSAEGRFICTSHNPAARLESVDGAWHDLGEFTRSDGGTFQVCLRARYDEETNIVVGKQRITFTDTSGGTKTESFDLRFSLVSLERLTAQAEQAGLRVAGLFGDYGGGSYNRLSSPAIIAVLEKAT